MIKERLYKLWINKNMVQNKNIDFIYDYILNSVRGSISQIKEKLKN